METATLVGAMSTVLFASSMVPMLVRAARTRDVSSYSRGHLALGNVGNLAHTVYVVSLPPGPGVGAARVPHPGDPADAGLARRVDPGSEEVVDRPVGLLEQLEDPGRPGGGVETLVEVVVGGVLASRRPGVQPRQEGVAVEAAQLEQHERIGVEQPGHLVEHGQRVGARVGPGRAAAAGLQLAAVGQQLDAGLLGVLDEGERQLAGQQRRDPARLRGDRLDQRVDRARRRAPGTDAVTVQTSSPSTTAA